MLLSLGGECDIIRELLEWAAIAAAPEGAGGFGGEVMKAHRIASRVACLLGVVLAAQASAQTTVPVTIQMPSVSVFTVDTTVVVPDSGRGYLGRVNRINQGRTSAGTPFGNKLMPGFGNHASGSETTHAGMNATATILDRTELDPYTREAALAMTSAARDENDRAGLAIDYLRARHAARALVARNEGQDGVGAGRWELSRTVPIATTQPSDVPSRQTDASLLESRSRGLLHFERVRGLSPIDSPSPLSRDREALRLRERAASAVNRGSPGNRPALDANRRRNYRVYPAPPDDASGSFSSRDRREPSGGSGQ